MGKENVIHLNATILLYISSTYLPFTYWSVYQAEYIIYKTATHLSIQISAFPYNFLQLLTAEKAPLISSTSTPNQPTNQLQLQKTYL